MNQKIKNAERLFRAFDSEVAKDKQEIEAEKLKFIQQMKSGLGEQINSFETYIKPEASIWGKMMVSINKIFKKI